MQAGSVVVKFGCMQPTQNDTNVTTNEIAEIDAAVDKATHPVDVINALDWRHEMLVSYMATNGLVFDVEAAESFVSNDGRRVVTGPPLKKMTMQELADICGVERKTLYRWKEAIPDFWKLVAIRRKELSGRDRLAKMHEEWFKKALTFKNWKVSESWLHNNDPDFKALVAKEPVDVKVTLSWAEQLQLKNNVIEGQVINRENQSENTNGSTTPGLQQQSQLQPQASQVSQTAAAV